MYLSFFLSWAVLWDVLGKLAVYWAACVLTLPRPGARWTCCGRLASCGRLSGRPGHVQRGGHAFEPIQATRSFSHSILSSGGVFHWPGPPELCPDVCYRLLPLLARLQLIRFTQ